MFKHSQGSLDMLVGPQSDIWLRFFVVSFENPKNGRPAPNNSRKFGWNRRLINNSDFTCAKRKDGLVMVDTKFEHNVQILERLDKLCIISVKPPQNARMNSV